ncbi:methionine synthase II (cobalamin-independent) [Bosea sp. BE271]|nr:methionine synthase II (cobalamin-independent) [Bosea robiniae]MDR6897936.1 methionine synthase II (cobalamin-independent) [Bosea sp. BE109]MDR7141305.1 methionine synthase II (cobalamin-independent) [Bosea sp. BE168]MDR7177967.1 methionine synthase II (cobalamin-independent) [Bosea sp. BE271]
MRESRAKFKDEIGPGVYDTHSLRVPDVGEMTELLKLVRRWLKDVQFWINPD